MELTLPCDAEIRAVITRADGTIVDVGLIAASYELSHDKQAEWDRNGLLRANDRIIAANMQGAE